MIREVNMRIGNIDLNQRVLVVAEIGNNHEGEMERAQRMIQAAAAAGAAGAATGLCPIGVACACACDCGDAMALPVANATVSSRSETCFMDELRWGTRA